MIEQHAVAEQHAGPQPQQAGAMLAVIKNRDFLKLWIAQILSQTAQQIINLALIVQVLDITGSSTAVSGIIISFTVPAILFAAIAGVFVERNSKKTMLVLTNVARGVMVLGYVLTDAAWGAGAVLPIFYVVTLLFSAVSQFFNPAELAMIPLLVRKDQLVSANSLFNLSFTACQLGGFVILGPLLIATVLHKNYALLYLILCGLYLACAVLTYFLPQDDTQLTAAERRKRGERVGVHELTAGASEIAMSGMTAARKELVEGYRFVRRDPVIFSAIMYWSIAITVFMMLGTIGPGFLQNVLKIDPSQLYVVLLPGGVGLVLGVLMVGRIATPENRQSMINYALFFAGAVLLVFAIIEPVVRWTFGLMRMGPPLPLMIGLLGFMALLLGVLNSFIGVPAQTAMQERAPESIRARVFSFFFTVQNIILVVPVLLAGALADFLGYPQTVALIGVIVIMIAGVGVYRLRKEQQLPTTASARPAASPVRHDHVTPAEAEAALASNVPGQRLPSSMTTHPPEPEEQEANPSG